MIEKVLILGSVLVLVLVSSAKMPSDPVKIRDCPGVNASLKAELKEVFISDCTDEPCKFKEGKVARGEMTIAIMGTVKKMKAELSAMLGLIPVALDWIEKDGCKGIMSEGHACPLKKDDDIRYGVDINIPKGTPKTEAEIKFQLTDAHNKNLICFILKTKLT